MKQVAQHLMAGNEETFNTLSGSYRDEADKRENKRERVFHLLLISLASLLIIQALFRFV